MPTNIPSAADPNYVVQDTDLIPLSDAAGSLDKSVTPAQFGIVEKDADGNVLANVVPRTGTLVSLLAISDAGDGEVATATDVEALVVYRGDPSVGQPYYKDNTAAMVGGTIGFTSVGVGVEVIPTLTAEYDPASLLVANEIVLPALPRVVGSKLTYKATINVFTSNTIPVGEFIKCHVEGWDITTLAWKFKAKPAVAWSHDATIAPDNTMVDLLSDVDTWFESGNTNETSKLRLVLSHNNAGTLFLFGYFEISIVETPL